MTQKNFYTTSEIAETLGISRIAVFKKIKEGKIKAEKIGRNYAIPKSEFSILIDESLSAKQKKILSEGVRKTVAEYGKTLEMLGAE